MNEVPQLPPQVSCLVEKLAADPAVCEIWLIGSQANGTATCASDWDFLVFSDQEPSVTNQRCEGIDVLWKGPSGAVLLEGQSEFHAFGFDDFRWTAQADDHAQFLGRKFADIEYGVASDLSESLQRRSIQRATRIWPSCLKATAS